MWEILFGLLFFGLFCYLLLNSLFFRILGILCISAFVLICVGLVRGKVEARRAAERMVQYEKDQAARGLVKFVDRRGISRWGTPDQVREWQIMDLGMRNGFAELTPREFEKLVADLFTRMGFQTELGPGIADFGTDIVARRGTDVVSIQVKKYSLGNNVGTQAVQQALGAMWKCGANKVVIVTTSDFTIRAQEQAKGAPIELWGRQVLCEMIEKHMLYPSA